MTKTTLKSCAFAKAAGLAAAAASREKLRPLSMVSLAATKHWLTISGCDGTVQISVRASAETGEDWSAAAPAALLARFAAAMPAGDTLLTFAPGHLAIDGGGVSFGASTKEAWSAMVAPKGEAKAEVPASALRELLRKTKFAISVDDTRKTILGLNLVLGSGILGATATDGRRLAHAEWIADEGADGDAEKFDVTLPRRTVDALAALLAKCRDEEEVSILADGKAAMFTGSEWSVTSEVLAEPFPAWRQVVPKDVPHSARLSRVPFVAARERAALAADVSGGVAVGLADGRATFGARSAETSAGAEIAACRVQDGATYNGVVSARMMLDALKALDDDEFRIEFSDDGAAKPIVFRNSAPWFCVLMPMWRS